MSSGVGRRPRAAFGSAREAAFDPSEIVAEERLELGEAALGTFTGRLQARRLPESGRSALELAAGSFC
jgi:hypothetical protein